MARRHGLGNGEQGVVCSGSPYCETLIYQNMYFIMPSPEPRFTPPEVTGELHEARQAVIRFDDTWNVNDRVRTYLYCFHPAHQIRLAMRDEGVTDYKRQTEYSTAEVSVRYTDSNGTWERKTFSSRSDNVTISRMTKSDRGVLICTDLSIDDVSSMKKFAASPYPGMQSNNESNMHYKKVGADDGSLLTLVAHYPAYEGSELKDGGYAGVTRILTVGGTRELVYGEESDEDVCVGNKHSPIVRIRDAEEVILITKTARTHHMGPFDAFASARQYDLVDTLAADLRGVAEKYTGPDGNFSYALALAPHQELQFRLFNAVDFRLQPGTDHKLYNEILIRKQKTSPELLPAMVERAYDQGRYAQICCSGYSSPRLCGLWTGEWNPGWNGAYTMDANVNLQAAGINTGAIYSAAVGFIYFVLRQIKDWEENAALVYGMKDALLVPVNTDGDIAVMVEYDQYYPFQYWNAGASWMLLPIFEFWQCYGNRKIPVTDAVKHLYSQAELDLEQDILYPLLTKQANFWEQICTPEYYTDKNGEACYQAGKKELSNGETYIILPSYSPENRPKGYRSTITANATMDISAARDGLKMIIALEKALAKDDWQEAVDKWEKLMAKLPAYQFDETGAIREWAMKEYLENNEHRHISHLYCAWPAYEAHNNAVLSNACNTAIENRNRENVGKDDTASHGWVHKALVAARLKNAESAYSILHTLLSSDIYFTSMMTDHNTDRSAGVYCTDTGIGLVGIINEMLLYSNTGEIELLPALPAQWSQGSINGLMARTNAQVTRLEWNLKDRTVCAAIRSNGEQSIQISCRSGAYEFRTATGQIYSNGETIHFEKGEEKEFSFVLETSGRSLCNAETPAQH